MQSIRLFLWILAICCLLSGQDYRGRITGLVTDSTRGIIAGATVELKNINTGVLTTRQTNDVGAYIFDYVEPGNYQLQVEYAGFKKFVQTIILVEARASLSIDAVLNPGSAGESITVSDNPVQVNVNNANVQLTIDTKLANDLPRFDRNPFKLSLLSPNAVNTRTEMNAYNSWAANSVELGGGTNLKNDLLVDGSPIGIGHKATYTPPQDAVQEVNVQQNSVDAESGHSAGGGISISMRSGTNDWHGNVWYLGRNPALNALTDRTANSRSLARNNMYGASLGNPILKNKLFNFAVYEVWKQQNPISYFRTLPTDLERQGDFSQSRNIDGGIRTIYDPFSTQFNAATGAVVRTPFAGNRIPTSRFDPTSQQFLGMLWKPNATPDNITNLNNFKTILSNRTDYWNFSDRVDYVINEKWRVSGRYSRLHTITTSNDPTENKSPLYIVQNPSARHATSVVGDAVWTLNATTIVNIHGDYHNLVDDFDSPRDYFPSSNLSKYWPNSDWYKSFVRADQLPSYIPGINIGSSSFGMGGTYWYQHPSGNSFSAKISQARGTHYWKAGAEFRHSGGASLVTGNTLFSFPQALTADTFNAPNTRVVGHEYATFLLGAIDNNSRAIVKPVKQPRSEFFGFFLQDDWKLNRNLTLNIGLRYEFDTPWYDPEHQMSRYLDLNAANPDLTANPPVMPPELRAYPAQPLQWNGQWYFTDNKNPYSWNRQWNNFMPRFGLAWRVDDKMSVRFGYSRFSTPSEYTFIDAPFSGFEALNYLEPAYMGYDATQSAQGLLNGVPQATLSNPYPADKNPLIPPRGKGFGAALGLGGAPSLWFNQNMRRPTNDRLSLSIQRQVPGKIVVDATAFINYGEGQLYSRNRNLQDPQLSYTYKSALQATVANPFYQYLTPAQFPGPNRNAPTVTLGSLLNPYPQYGSIFEVGNNGFRNRYQSIAIQARRPFQNGFNFLMGYAYIRERNDGFFNDPEYYANQPRLIESANPRHRLNGAGSYELPFGKGRAWMSNSNRILDGVLGGWQVLGAIYANSGAFLNFGALQVTGDPRISNPTPQAWFNKSVFTVLPAFTPRTNPINYSGLTGPMTLQLDATLSKNFRITERIKTELKMSAYNATNRLNRADPDLGVTSSTFGQAIRQRGNYFGRQLELGLKIAF
ncbi:carboxypeptidase regulatory-like domain-containing protein [Bryobacter aggregatus]|uniref:carboxypeptidase regulatory-like domain-containing protein n=1 Tax=Bryobacter aggregatus TaxID=360054 RepID=UPI0004E0E1B1|nr:carboxypeptidase regulatory-like domain-containing protein [Bryobacter aggregatus]